MICLKVMGEPQARQSMRFGQGHAYQDEDSPASHWKNMILAEVLKCRPPKLLDCALAMAVKYFFRPPQKYRFKRGFNWKQSKPDVQDNLNKVVGDALQGMIYTNDSRIALFIGMKLYSATPRAEIKICLADSPEVLQLMDWICQQEA